MPYAILLTLSLTDIMNTFVIGWFVYKLNRAQPIQQATAFPFQASAPEADLSMIESMNEKQY